ncbi:MAG: hypothetical protein Kow0063_40420 [Anaerolineae bacterium]
MLSSIDKDTVSLILNGVTLILAAAAICIAFRELRATRNTTWADFLLRLDQRFLEGPIREISEQIEKGTLDPAQYDKWALVNYLATFELFYEFREKGILDKDVIEHYYAHSILKAYYYPGILTTVI